MQQVENFMVIRSDENQPDSDKIIFEAKMTKKLCVLQGM
jgi:hypothetical protein